MDNITHSLVGALLGQAGLKKKTGLAMPVLIIGANLPDIDAACLFWLDGVEHLGFRRGITHGPPALVLLPLILAGLLYGFDRWQAKRGTRPKGRLPVHFGWLYGLAFIACLTHPALDWLNVYGIRLLEPFSHQWFYGDTLFIVDVWLWAVMGFATWFSLRREKRGKSWRWPAFTAIAISLAYIGNNYVDSEWRKVVYTINEKVIPNERNDFEQPQRYRRSVMIASPVPVKFWDREIIIGENNNWRIIQAGKLAAPKNAKPVTMARCGWPTEEQLANGGSQAQSFLFWSRAPFAERAADGSVILYDARFYDPRVRERFSVPLPDVKCEPID